MATFGERILAIAQEPDLDEALHLICATAQQETNASNALLATMNDELGVLELTHGSDSQAKGSKLEVDIGAGFGIIAYVAATGETVRSGNVHELEQYRLRYASTISEIALPVYDRSRRVRAVLNLESDLPNAFTDSHLSTCQVLTGLCATIFERREGERRAEALTQLGRAMETVMREEDLIQRVLRVSQEVLGFQACSLFLLDPAIDRFVLRGSISPLKERIGEISYGRDEGLTGWVCDSGQSILLSEPQENPRWRGRYVEFPSDEIASLLAVPIATRGQCIGCIRLLRRKPGNKYLDVRYTESDKEVLNAMAEQFAVGLENLRNLESVVRSERMIAWGELSAKSSHMIGNRVFALKGDVNELKYQLNLEPIHAEGLRELQVSLATNVLRLEELLQEFRDFLTATRLSLEIGDINKIIQETCKEVFPKRGKIQLVTLLADDIPEIYLDRGKIQRAFSELIENSLQHTQEGVLRLSSAVDREGKWVRIELSDSGHGVPEAKKQLIFQPFFSGRVKGMGLGLSIVKGIVEAHGGHISEEGVEGSGAKFVILLPIPDRP